MKRIFRFLPFLALLALALPLLTACGATVKTRVYNIPPSATAYLLPASQPKDQKKFESEQYLHDNQVPDKTVRITFSRYDQTNELAPQHGWTADNLLILVDRTPQTREWTSDKETGTSSQNQAFHLETKEAIDFLLGETCTGSVQGDNAAKFLYNFGGSSLQAVQSDDEKKEGLPPAVYQSVSVANVMDNNVRGSFQSHLFARFHELTLDDARAQAGTVLTAVTADVVKEFADQGLTLSNCGGQGGLTFTDPKVQQAINDRFIALQAAQADKDKALLAQQTADARYQAQLSENKRLLAEAEGQAAAAKAAKQPEVDFYTTLIKLCHDNPGIDCSQIIAATKYQGGVPQYAPYPQYPAVPLPSSAPAPSPSPSPSH